jgi:hypothetical protein
MQIVIQPLTEGEILAPTSTAATGEQIKYDIETKAESCVNHLCGCKS